jgi:prevent-host-death family protein
MASKTKKRLPEVAISKFKAECLSLVEEVNKTKTPLRVTRRGKPIAEVFPASPEAPGAAWIGSLAGSVDIIGEIVSPVIDIREIEALRN